MDVENSEMDELILLDEDNEDADQLEIHAHVSTSGPTGSSTSAPSQQPQQPHQRCPICLNEMNDPTILSGCEHSFCFECILEWLKMKPQCPLCKSATKHLKHNLRVPSIKEGRLTWDSTGECKAVADLRAYYEMENILDSTSYSPDVEKHAVIRVISRLNDEINHLRAISQNGHGRASTYQQAITELQEELDAYEDLLNRFAFASRRELFSTPAFRRVIYLRNLSPRSIVSPRFDIVFNTDYVRNHETSVREQLLEYVAREVSSLTRDACADIEEVMTNLIDYIAGRTNRIAIVTYLHHRGIAHPHQFLNNLIHFAGTGQSLSVYDQNSEFVPRSANHIPPYRADAADDVLVLNDEANADIQVVGESMRPRRSVPEQPEINNIVTPHIVELDDDGEELFELSSSFARQGKTKEDDLYISSDDSDIEALP